jgi:hypothetical protein
MTAKEQFHELSFYTLSLQDKYFIHQHIVDAYAAQTADINTKPIKIIFALAGLYLFIEKKYTGREVQLAHVQMAKGKKIFPPIILPANRGDINVSDVLVKPAGKERDEMIKQWCVSVWDAYQNNRDTIISFTETSL